MAADTIKNNQKITEIKISSDSFESIQNVTDFDFLKQLASAIIMGLSSKTALCSFAEALELLVFIEKESDMSTYKIILFEKITILYEKKQQSISTGNIRNDIQFLY